MRNVILLFFLMLASLPGTECLAEVSQGNTVSGVFFDYPGELPEGVRELAGIKKGDAYSARKIRDSIKRIYLKGAFEGISVEGRDTDTGVEITYHLKPKLRISRIKVKGNKEVGKKKIMPRLVLKEGDFVELALIEKSRDSILKLYLDEGFRKAIVDIAPQKKDSLQAVLEVTINEGAPDRVGPVTISGDPMFPREELIKIMKLDAGEILSKETFEKSVSVLTDYYVKKDYVKVEINTSETAMPDGNTALDFNVQAGPRLEVSFTGNKSVSDKNLKKILTFWEDKDVSDESISENRDKINEYLNNEGYYFSTVTSRTEQSVAPPVISVTFIVNEGPRPMLEKVDISGNKEFRSDQIRDILESRESSWYKSRYINKETVERDVEKIKSYYETRGYLKAGVESDTKFSDDSRAAFLNINITEGIKTVVSSVSVNDGNGVKKDAILKELKLKAGSPLNPQQQKEDENSILNLYSQQGFVDAAVDIGIKFSEDGGSVDLAYNIKENGKVTVGDIILRGNEYTKDKVILRELAVKSGEPLDYEKILKSQQKIYKLGFFSQVRMQPLEQQKGEPVQDILVSIKEKDPGAVEFGVGYGDWDRIRGFSEVSYRNILGLGHRITARAEVSTKETKTLLSYRWPWFLDYKLDFHSSLVYLDAQKPNYHIRDFIGNTGFDKSFGEHITTSLMYQYEKIKLGTIRAGAELAPEDRKKSNLASINPSAIFDYRDNPLNPTKGSVHAVIIKIASKYLGSTVDFAKLSLQTGWYFPVYKKILFAFSARGGMEGWFQSKFEIPISERFFLGGASSIRGYNFETVAPKAKDGTPTGGDSMALFNVEVRFPLPYEFGLVTFLDAGNAWLLNKDVSAENFKQTGTNGLRYGAGVGLRYNTPVGPLRLDYGLKLNPLPGESRGQLHFTIGQAF